MINYRNIVPSDVVDLLELIEDYCKENNLSYDIASAKGYIDAQLGKIPAIAAVDNNKVVGVISFIIIPNPYDNKVFMGRKLACWVKKEYNDKGIGTQLIKHAEDICRDQGAKTFHFSGTKELNGYKVFEVDYVKEL